MERGRQKSWAEYKIQSHDFRIGSSTDRQTGCSNQEHTLKHVNVIGHRYRHINLSEHSVTLP